MASKKKLATAAVAVTAAAAILLSGTFAWQSISQTALNEASDVVNPGGRLHDDFDGSNKDVYVENFTDPNNNGEEIYARIRLEEYFEIVMNYGTPTQRVETVVGSTVDLTDGTEATGSNIVYDGGNALYERVYATKIIESVENGVVHAAVVGGTYDENAGEGAEGYSWWNWQTGGSTVYMPTFNKNKDSLAADLNGKFDGTVGVITDRDDDQYTDYIDYSALGVGYPEDGTEIYDADSNNIEDDNVIQEAETHYAATTTYSGELMSMQEWIDAGSQRGPYWVYDTDGWIYWAQPIPAGETTGLLLDGIELNQVMDDTWYYAINVVAQFVTADDLGKTDNTGFYADGETVSEDALILLETIGVDVSGDAAEVPDDGDNDELTKEEADYSITDEDNNVTYYKFSDRPALSNGHYKFTLENIPEDTISFWTESSNMPDNYGFTYQSLEAWFSVNGASTDGEEMCIMAYTIDDEEYATIYFSYDDSEEGTGLNLAANGEKLIASDGTKTVTLTATDDYNQTIENVDWSANNTTVTVSDNGTVTADSTMESNIEPVTVTAVANGSSSDITLYMYDSTVHNYEWSYTDETGTYHAFKQAVSSYDLSMGDPEYLCVYKEDTDASTIYTISVEGSLTPEAYRAAIVDIYNDVYSDSFQGYSKDFCDCRGSGSNPGTSYTMTASILKNGENVTGIELGETYDVQIVVNGEFDSTTEDITAALYYTDGNVVEEITDVPINLSTAEDNLFTSSFTIPTTRTDLVDKVVYVKAVGIPSGIEDESAYTYVREATIKYTVNYADGTDASENVVNTNGTLDGKYINLNVFDDPGTEYKITFTNLTGEWTWDGDPTECLWDQESSSLTFTYSSSRDYIAWNSDGEKLTLNVYSALNMAFQNTEFTNYIGGSTRYIQVDKEAGYTIFGNYNNGNVDYELVPIEDGSANYEIEDVDNSLNSQMIIKHLCASEDECQCTGVYQLKATTNDNHEQLSDELFSFNPHGVYLAVKDDYGNFACYEDKYSHVGRIGEDNVVYLAMKKNNGENDVGDFTLSTNKDKLTLDDYGVGNVTFEPNTEVAGEYILTINKEVANEDEAYKYLDFYVTGKSEDSAYGELQGSDGNYINFHVTLN